MHLPSEYVPALSGIAQEYLERGWSIIPVNRETKRPLIEWQKYQSELPEEAAISSWFAAPVNIGIVTGIVSGIVVVDCDNEEAIRACEKANLASPVYVNTGRGRHYYFRHPGRHARVPNAVNFNGMSGVDIRGDGGYVVAPPSYHANGNQYTWGGTGDIDDLPEWRVTTQGIALVDFDFGSLDLSTVRPEGSSWWEMMADRVARSGKLRDGDGRNDALTRYIGECVARDITGQALVAEIQRFQEAFFADPLPQREIVTTLRSILQAESRKEKERQEPEQQPAKFPGLTTGQLISIVSSRPAREPCMSPFIPEASITQLYSWTGVGKSMLSETLAFFMATGKSFGPFSVPRPRRILYFDFENGQHTLMKRHVEMVAAYGDPGDNIIWYAPSVEDEARALNLRAQKDLSYFQKIIEHYGPEVVFLDTIRSAFPGMEENRAEEWSIFNRLVVEIRNSGKAVVAVHHANAPSEGRLGYEAGSKNQLSNIETQVRLARLCKSEEQAEQFRGKLAVEEWRRLDTYASSRKERCIHAVELSYGKVRDWNDSFVPRIIGWFKDTRDVIRARVILTPREQAVVLRERGQSFQEIALKLSVNGADVRSWIAEDRPDLL